VSVVSHELRSPITSVAGAAQTLRRRWDTLSAHERDACFDVVDNESRRLVQLASDVLETSLIEAGTFTYSFAEVDIGTLVHAAAEAARSGPAAVRVRVADGLPGVRADRGRLRQVITNLVDNAIRYEPVDGAVDVRAYPLDGRVCVDVTDHGPGIAGEDQERIFEKFGRAGGGTKHGTGLGLFIARSIAEAHGGTLEVESAPERGSTFTLSLPAA
jgi:signal transduction histidine kinase